MKRIILFLIFLAVLVSCDDDESGNILNFNDTEEEITDAGFFNLTVGNRWTYEIFQRVGDTDTFETSNIIFTREVINEEVINGETIFTIEQNSNDDAIVFPTISEGVSTVQIKDSLGFLVQLNHGILFSSVNTNEYLIAEPEFADVIGRLLDFTENTTVPAGNFNCTVNEVFALEEDGNILPGRNNELYADGIGLVLSRQSFVSNPQHFFEVRLINFDFRN